LSVPSLRLALLLLLPALPCAASTLTVAAAADLQPVLPEIARLYQQRTGDKVKLIFGSSGNLVAQIQQGAPADLFLSADLAHARQVARRPADLRPYAVGQLVLWMRPGSPVDPAQPGLRALLDPRIRRIAIANPRHAPYGQAAEAALRHFGLYQQLEPKLVVAENVAQAAQWVQSGAADAGLVGLAVVLSASSGGAHWLVPAEAYPALEQAAVPLATGPAAQRFLDFLLAPEAQEIFRRWGFLPPPRKSEPR
jgi:molybdate transport system substrate-binding protein